MFTLKKTNNRARRGLLELPHGQIETPFFMPIATRGAVKTMSSIEWINLKFSHRSKTITVKSRKFNYLTFQKRGQKALLDGRHWMNYLLT